MDGSDQENYVFSTTEAAAHLAFIRSLNDRLRSSLAGGRIMITRGVHELGECALAEILAKVRSYSAFTPDNDPHGEHDFGSFDVAGRHSQQAKILWKIDYYDNQLARGSSDAADPNVTTRVLTIMLSSEY